MHCIEAVLRITAALYLLASLEHYAMQCNFIAAVFPLWQFIVLQGISNTFCVDSTVFHIHLCVCVFAIYKIRGNVTEKSMLETKDPF